MAPLMAIGAGSAGAAASILAKETLLEMHLRRIAGMPATKDMTFAMLHAGPMERAGRCAIEPWWRN